MKYLFTIAFAILLLITSCEKKEVLPSYSSLKINFVNTINSIPIKLNSNYLSPNNEEFSISTLNYFISNMELVRQDGNKIVLDNQYFLIKESDLNSKIIQIDSLPTGTYSSINFIIGVDSLKNTSPLEERIGVLDPASYGTDNMYWSWNSGYIFLKMEGLAANAPTDNSGTNSYKYHIGGFGGLSSATVNNIKKVSLDFSIPLVLEGANTASFNLEAKIESIFKGSNSIDFANYHIVMNPAKGKFIADNYAKMFVVNSIKGE